jgi:hypothetical protein
MFFGLPKGNDGVNILNSFPPITNMLRGESMGINLFVNGYEYSKYYLFTNGIIVGDHALCRSLNI